MPTLTIVAHIEARPDHAQLVKTELEKLIPITRAEAGCLRYDLHRDNEDPLHFMFYETWESRELWRAHMEAPHLRAYLAATEGAVAAFRLHELTQIA